MKIDHDGVARGSFDAFVQIIAALRAEDGCPWDRAQTFQSLKPCMVNEMTEALAGIDLYEASGDVLLQVVLLAQIAREEGLFSIEDVVRGISRKMLRRHTHVFGAESGELQAGDVPKRWEEIKREEKKNRTPEQERREKEAFAEAARQVTAQLKAAAES